MGRALFVVAPMDYQDREFGESKAELEKAGVSVVVASTVACTAKGVLGGSVQAQALPKNPDGYDAVVFIGGGGVEEHALYEKPAVLALAREFAAKGRAVAAICIAPRILAKAGLLRGKNATAFPDNETLAMLRDAGAKFTGTPVETDGKIITADGPSSARAFGRAISEAI